MIEITAEILELLSEPSSAAMLEDHRKEMRPSAHPQAILMFAKLAAHHAGEIERDRDDCYDFSHAMNFKTLAACLARYVDPAMQPSFEEPLRPDEEVRRLFARQIMEETNLHQAACMRNGLRRSFYDPSADTFHLCLTKRRRRSALVLLDAPAEFELLNDSTGGQLAEGTASLDVIMSAFASSAEHLRFVREAHPASWDQFEKAACSANELAAFAAFLSFLEFAAREVGHSLIYPPEKLAVLAEIFNSAFPLLKLEQDRLTELLDLFSLTPVEADRLLLPAPFFRIDQQYLRYEGFGHVMNPAMGLLTIAIRKHEKAWSNSVGSTLAYAADAVASSLPRFERLVVAVRRKLKGKGDIDLGLYDTVSGHFLVCEVKTVYDKHRTVLHMNRFEEAKVNLSKALAQLNESITAIVSGEVTMQAIFGRKLPVPRRVSGALLTWFDAVDLTVGTPDEDVLCLNFATLRFLVGRSAGNIDDLCNAVHELRNIWCVSVRCPIDLQIEVPVWIEEQLGLLDAPSDIAKLKLSPLTQMMVEAMPTYSGKALEGMEEMPYIVSYLHDSLERLGPSTFAQASI